MLKLNIFKWSCCDDFLVNEIMLALPLTVDLHFLSICLVAFHVKKSSTVRF